MEFKDMEGQEQDDRLLLEEEERKENERVD
jgi:hypothetical protein